MSPADRIIKLEFALDALDVAKAHALAAIGADTDAGNDLAIQFENLAADMHADVESILGHQL